MTERDTVAAGGGYGGDGYLLCGHGSRDLGAVAGFAAIARGLAPQLAGRPFAHGFMELAEPDLEAAVGTLAAAGATRILAIPGFLFAARHVREDLPRLLATAAARHGVAWHLGRELGADPRLVSALAERARVAAAGAVAAEPAARAGTGLALVGAGSSDAGANAALMTLAKEVRHALGFGDAIACYASVASPPVGAAVEALAARGFARVLLLPWFLTEGNLLRQARAEARAAAAGRVELAEAEVLGAHPLVLDTLAARAHALAETLSP